MVFENDVKVPWYSKRTSGRRHIRVLGVQTRRFEVV
jgi:hypothetical protein